MMAGGAAQMPFRREVRSSPGAQVLLATDRLVMK
jgi:hypothetical protein